MPENNSRGIVLPGQVKVQVQYMEAPGAHPSTATMNTPQGPMVLVVGGLTKLEWMAGMVACGKHARAGATRGCETIVSAAEQILLECQKRQKAQGGGEQ